MIPRSAHQNAPGTTLLHWQDVATRGLVYGGEKESKWRLGVGMEAAFDRNPETVWSHSASEVWLQYQFAGAPPALSVSIESPAAHTRPVSTQGLGVQGIQ